MTPEQRKQHQTLVDQRNALIEQCWIPATTPPDPLPAGKHYPITVFAVIDDPYFSEEPFVDIASYWPASKLYTCTHQVSADSEAVDHPVQVIKYQPLFSV